MNTVLHYDRGSSDKVYVGSIVDDGNGRWKVICKWGRRGKSMQSQDKGVFNSRSMAESELSIITRGKEKKGYVDIESSRYDGTLTMNNSWLRTYLEDDNVAVADPAPEALLAPTTGEEVAKAISNTTKQQVVELLKKGQRIKAVKAVRAATNCLLAPAKEYIDDILEPEINSKNAMAPASGERDFEVVCVNNLGMEESFDEGVTYVAEPHSDSDYLYVWDRNAQKLEVFKERFKKAEVEISSMRDMRQQPVAV